ncbi:MAG: hypothetical protein RDV48_11070 [Candidatus Eremiobacteraeota bacterium]|nr:hypothetical protein [Candidatus Eremiobacteraeota bacterium]
MKRGKWRRGAFIFLSVLLFFHGAAQAKDFFKVQKVTQLQYLIGREHDGPAKPTVSWTGPPDILLIDGRTLFFPRKNKLFQVYPADGQEAAPLKVALAPNGIRFACSSGDGLMGMGSIDSFEVSPLRERTWFDKAEWAKDSRTLYFTRSGGLFRARFGEGYSDKLFDGVTDFFLSSDEKRVVLKSSRAEEKEPLYYLATLGSSSKEPLPRGGLFTERRGQYPFFRNMSGDFRRVLIEKRGAQQKGFILYRIDWKNLLSESRTILEDSRGAMDAAFSPDGSKIALTCRDGAGASSMVVLTSLGDILVRFSLKKDWVYQNPLWSPRSDRILWNYIDTDKPEDERSRSLISDVKGVSISFLPVAVNPSEAYWSPRGDAIILKQPDRSSRVGSYVVYDIHRKKLKELFKDDKNRATSRPVWSPEGESIAIIDYSTFQKREKRGDTENVYFREQIFLYTPSDESLQLLW